MKTIERTIYSLCNQIDYLKQEVSYWKELYETERAENTEQLNQRLEEGKKGIANALMFALSCSDDENGNLVIRKEDRKVLADNYQK